MTNHTHAVAHIISEAADQALGVRPDGKPKRHDLVAAEAIAFKYLLIPREELPAVKDSDHDTNTYYVENENVVYTSEQNARMWVMRDIAVWQHIVEKKSAATKRRNELRLELIGGPTDCTTPSLEKAIDRIIELERSSR